MILIAGPCQLESKEHAIDCALFIKSVLESFPKIDFYFKTSFDKANRTSGSSSRGAGILELEEAFNVLRKDHGIKTLTDIHEPYQALRLSTCTDVLQIPAMLSRQTDLLSQAGKHGSYVNIKKGQFMAPQDMKYARQKVEVGYPNTKNRTPSNHIFLTERGTTFGYNNLVVDMRSLYIMKEENPNAKIIFDATHSCQLPSASDGKSGGDRKFTLPLAKAALSTGYCDGLFIETHEDPDNAPSDGPNMIPFENLFDFLEEVYGIID